MLEQRRLRLVLPLASAVILMGLVFLALHVPIAHSQDSDENDLGPDDSGTAEDQRDPAPPVTAGANPELVGNPYRLFTGNDASPLPQHLIDVTAGNFITAFAGIDAWGAAYDPVTNKLYHSDGSNLYEWSPGGTPSLVGAVEDGMANPVNLHGLAFYDRTLYGSSITTDAIYTIDPGTLVATPIITLVDTSASISGLAIDPRTGEMYGTDDISNDGLVRINNDGTLTLVAAYIGGETDVDGLAISPNGRAYLITDDPTPAYFNVVDLDSMTYVGTVPYPWGGATAVQVAGAWIEIPGAVADVQVCSAPGLAIPDNVPAGVTDQLTYEQDFRLTDLNVVLTATHTWVGDLVFTLTHQTSGVQAVIFDRPGVPAATFGCASNDIAVSIDDEGLDGNVENTCIPGSPAIAGDLVGGDPPDATLLGAFDGWDLGGDWTLNVSDNAGGDTGTLDAWCLVAEGYGHPEITVDPTDVQTVQPPAEQVVRQITLSNNGLGVLEWLEQEETAPPAVAEPAAQAPQVDLAETPAAPDSGATELSYYSSEGPRLPSAVSNPPMAFSTGPAEAGLVYYGQRATFDAAFPALPVEDFEAGLWSDGAILGCPAPFNESTNNACFAPGGILPGVSFQDNPLNDAGGGSASGLAGIGAGAAGATSKNIVANTFVDSFEIQFNPAVNAAGMDLVHYVSNGALVDVVIYDASDVPIATTTAWANNAGEFWGVHSATPIGRINIHSTVTGGDGAEGVDNVAFGTADVCSVPEDIPWLSVDPISGTVPVNGSQPVDLTFDSTGLATGQYAGTLCINSNDPLNPSLRVPVTMTVAPPPSIVLTKTVGLDPGACAAGDTLDVTAGSEGVQVTYCYEVENTGIFTLSNHDLVDDRLGTILSGFAYDLVPGATVFLTTTASLTEDTVNTATWTATGSLGPPASDEDSASVTVNYEVHLPFVTRPPAVAASSPRPQIWLAPGLTSGLLFMALVVRRRR